MDEDKYQKANKVLSEIIIIFIKDHKKLIQLIKFIKILKILNYQQNLHLKKFNKDLQKLLMLVIKRNIIIIQKIIQNLK